MPNFAEKFDSSAQKIESLPQHVDKCGGQDALQSYRLSRETQAPILKCGGTGNITLHDLDVVGHDDKVPAMQHSDAGKPAALPQSDTNASGGESKDGTNKKQELSSDKKQVSHGDKKTVTSFEFN